MTYRGHHTVARGALGCTAGRPCGHLGDDAPASSSAVEALQRQLNRYATAPAALRITTLLPVNGVLDTATAAAAVQVVYRRSVDAYTVFSAAERPGGASYQLLVDASRAISNPVPYVAADVGGITRIVQMYGDAKGLPPAPGVIERLVSDPRVLAGAGALALLYFLGRR